MALLEKRAWDAPQRPDGNAVDARSAEEALRESLELYHALVEGLDVFLCRWLPDTTLIDTNERYRMLFGREDDMRGQSWLELIPEPSRATTAAFYQELCREPRTVSYAHEVVAADGDMRYIHWTDTPLFDAAGRLAQFQSVGVDITERRQAEEMIAVQRDLARLMASASSTEVVYPRCLELALRISGMDCGGISLFDAGCQCLSLAYSQGLSEAFVRDVVSSSLDKSTVELILAGETTHLTAEALGDMPPLQREGLTCLVVLPIHVQGQILGCVNLASHTLRRIPAFALQALETISTEIGNVIVHLRTTLALREREEQYRGLVDSQESIIATLDADGVFHFINQLGAAPLAGLPEAVVGRRLDDFFPWSSVAWHLKQIRQVIATGQGKVVEVRQQLAGEPRWYRMSIQPIRNSAGAVVLAMLNAVDITERKQVEEQLGESQLRAELAIDGASLGTWDWYVQTGAAVFNERWAEITGRTLDEIEPLGLRAWNSLCHPDDLARADQQLQRHFARETAYYECEARMRHKSGEWVWVIDRGKVVEWDADGAPLRMAGTLLDITERKRAELDLQLSEEHYRGLMESLDSIVVTVDAAGTFLYLNPVAARLFDGLSDDSIGKTMGDLFSMSHVRAAIMEDRVVTLESRSRIRGEWRWYHTSISPIHDEAGQVLYALVHATDIHDLKVAQEQLLELNQTLELRVAQRTAEVRDLYDNAPVGYHSLDSEGRLVLINQTELDWLGYTREELIGRPLAELMAPASQGSSAAILALLKEQGWLRDLELELVRKDGSTFPGLINATAVYDETGAFVMSRSTLTDITARHQVEKALRESEAQNRLLFEEAPDAVVLFDEAGAVVQANRAFELLTGVAGEQLAGRALDEIGLVSGEQLALLGAGVVAGPGADGNVAGVELSLRRVGEARRVVGAKAFAVQIRGRAYTLATMHDITAEKEVEATLRRANAELARAARAKDDFLANMSHELRTPLNAILAYSESLQEGIFGTLSERQLIRVQHIETSGRHLLTLINDILDLSKVEAGRLELEAQRVTVAELCQASLIFVRELAVKKSLRLGLQIGDHTAQMEADPKRLKQMLVNLLSNAVKFTPSGGQVSLEVTIDAGAREIAFAVRDTGIGIAQDELARLFQPFSQLDSSLSRHHEGTGLGLALVRRLAKLHGGSVTVESEPGVGSCFTIRLPYRRPAPLEERPPAPASRAEAVESAAGCAERVTGQATARTAAGQVLLVEDNENSITTIVDYLSEKGFEVRVARDGHEALAAVAERRPELIMTDIQMPAIDGLELMRRLRATPDFARTPIIALTALAMRGDRERCLEAGASAYVAKPVRLRDLQELICQLLAQ